MAASSRSRGPVVLAVWLAVTASAVAVVWLGMDSVVGAQVDGSPLQLTPVESSGAAGEVLPVDPLGLGVGHPATTAPSPTAGPTVAPRTQAPAPPPGTPNPPPSHSSPSTVSDLHRYTMVGGTVVAQIDGDNVNFVSATPNSGYAMQDWIEDEWLRVDFTNDSNNKLVYELFITWNGYSPQVTENGPNS